MGLDRFDNFTELKTGFYSYYVREIKIFISPFFFQINLQNILIPSIWFDGTLETIFLWLCCVEASEFHWQ